MDSQPTSVTTGSSLSALIGSDARLSHAIASVSLDVSGQRYNPAHAHTRWPRLIYDGGQLAGFIMAAFAPEHENALFHSYLWRRNIGAEHQGKGYGRFAVEALCQEAMRRGQRRLTVSYHPN